MCSQNDQRDVGIILSHGCWGRTPPPPPARQGQRQPKPPCRHGDQGVREGVGQMGFRAIPPPPPPQSLPALLTGGGGGGGPQTNVAQKEHCVAQIILMSKCWGNKCCQTAAK